MGAADVTGLCDRGETVDGGSSQSTWAEWAARCRAASFSTRSLPWSVT
jgi:hypothetical protein